MTESNNTVTARGEDGQYPTAEDYAASWASKCEDLARETRRSTALAAEVADLRARLIGARSRSDLLDLLWDEGFPNDPQMSGALRSEIERLEHQRIKAALTGSTDGADR